jgi:aminocarboxymuconate-semialdehyde decarboxylase
MIPIATLPMQSSEYAITELKAAHALGCKGIEIGTDIPGTEIDSPELENFWTTVENLSIPVLLHPTFQVIPARLRRQGLKNAVGRAAETTISLSLLLYSGVFIRHPGLVIIAAHGGGSFIWLIDRIIRNSELGFAKTEADLHASLKQLYFDSIVLNPVSLQYLVNQVDADHILLGSDSPYAWEPDPVGTVMQTNLSKADKKAILGRTASRLFKITGENDIRK